MKNINYIKKALLLVAFSFAIISCDRDDNIGDSVTAPSSPATTITLNFSESVTLTENDQEFTFSVTLSTTQVADIQLYVEQVGGDADGDDYEATGLITIPAGSTTGSGTIKILHDEIIEGTETLALQIGDQRTANTSMTPVTANFTILNVTNDDLVINLSWESSELATDHTGIEYDPTDLADLRLLITDTDGNILDGADGGSFETYVFDGLNADGEYLIVADFYDAIDHLDKDLNLFVDFHQTGTINGLSMEFENALNIQDVCSANFFVLASFTKSSGTPVNYDINSIGNNNFESQALDWSMGYDASDAFVPGGYPSHITSAIDCVGTYVLGLNSEWMQTTWGEEILDEANVYYTVDGSGNITIPSQYVFTSLYNGSEYVYTVSGNGVLDLDAGTLTINYYLDQEGFSPNGWMFANGYMAQDYFIANVSL